MQSTALPLDGATRANAPAGPAGGLVGTDHFFQPRRAAFWLLVLLLAHGLIFTVQLFAAGVRVVPLTFGLGLGVWAVFTLAFWAAFRLLELSEQQPADAFILAFAWGGLAAVSLAVPANAAILSLLAKLGSPELAATWGAAAAGPVTEEFLKLMGVLLLILVARSQFRTELSVLVVGATVGLGFQVIENLHATVTTALRYPVESQVLPVLQNLISRGLLSGLWTHAAYTTVASYGVAWYLRHTERSRAARIAMAVASFAVAWAMHFVWNSPWLEEHFDHSRWGLALLLVIKGVPVAGAAALLWRAAMRQEGQHLQRLAEHFVPERELLTDEERTRLGAPLERLRVRRALGRQYGRRARRLKAKLQREQLRLVMKAGVYGRGARTVRHEVAIRRTRARLDGLTMAA